MADNLNSLRESINSMREFRKTQTTNTTKNKQSALLSLLTEDFGNTNNQNFQEIQEAITQAVNAPCTITNYNDADGNKIEVRGVIKFSSEVNFLFTTNQTDGAYIWTSSKGLQLDEDIIQSIMKLRAYYDTWFQENMQDIN